MEKTQNKSIRDRELNYLSKFFPQIKNGYAKSVLITGDSGSGKTTLLSEFAHISKNANCVVLNIDKLNSCTYEDLFVCIFESFEKGCRRIIQETLIKINSFYDNQKIWKEKDIKKALNILKLQVDPNDEITPLKISKALKGSMNIFSRIIPNFDGSIDVISELLYDPWVIMAYNLDNPAYSNFSNAITLVNMAKNKQINNANASNIYKEAIFNFLFHINKNLKEKDTAFVITIDNFEDIANYKPREKDNILRFFNELLETIHNNNALNLMLIVSCASETQSRALSHSLYAQFTNRILLSSLSFEESIELTQSIIDRKQIACCSSIVDFIAEFSNGMPYWINRCLCFCKQIALTINTEDLTKDLLVKFLPESCEDILKSLYSILSNRYNNNNQDFTALLDFITSVDGYFSIFSIAQTLHCTERFVQDVITGLLEFEFIQFQPGQGYIFRNKIDKMFFVNELKSKDVFNVQLVTLISLLSEVKRLILNTENPEIPVSKLLAYKDSSIYPGMEKQLIKLLRSALSHNNSKVRIAAICGLKLLNDYNSAIAISTMFKDSDEEVKIVALEALYIILCNLDKTKNDLTSIIPTLQVVLHDKNPTIRIKAIETLCLFNLDVIHPIIKTFLNDSNEFVTATILTSLSKKIKNSDLFIYKDKSKDKSPLVRSIVAKNLYKFNDDKAFEILTTLLNDKEKIVRIEAAKSLGKQGYSEAFKVLISAINDTEEEVKLEIIKSLGLIGDTRAIPYIHKEITENTSITIQWIGTKALGNIPSKDSVSALDRSLISNNLFIKEAAYSSVQKIHTALESK